MRKFLFQIFTLSYLFLGGHHCIIGQNIQWANEVIAYSSQYQDYYYSAHQALGVTNGIYHENLIYMAWAPKKEESNVGEYLHVGFEEPMRIRQVAVAENLNPGTISRIWLFDNKGKKYKIYENDNPGPVSYDARMFRHTFEQTEYYVKELKVELNTKAVEGQNQIDAIAISDNEEPIKAIVDEIYYASGIGEPERLSAGVNSNFPERLPIISPDGQSLYFARKYHPQNRGEENKDDIWVAYKESDDSWSKAINIGAPLNNEDDNFVVAINPTSNLIYLANEYTSSKKDGVSVAKKQGRLWSKPKTLEIENHYNENKFVGYHFGVDGRTMILAVQRSDTYGDRDLYVSFLKDNNTWSEPKNLGPDINTVCVENTAFLAADGKTIYFSSNGHPGLGGFDMFMSRRLDDSWRRWSKPKNIGNRINTKLNDFNLTIPASGDYAYFSSGSMNNSDLYRIQLPEELQPEPVTLITARLVDAETGKSLQGKLNYESLNPNQTQSKEGVIANSEHKIVFPFGENVGMHAEVDGYFSVSENMRLANESLKELDADDFTASTHTPDLAIEQLQFKLKELKGDLISIESKRKTIPVTSRKITNTRKSSNTKKDSELEALKNKYNRIMNAGKKKPATSGPSKKVEKDDSELNDLQKKFKQHYNRKEEPAIVDDENVDQSEEIDFDAYQASVREELVQELEPLVRKKLYVQLYSEAKEEVLPELSVELQTKISSNLEDKVLEQLEENIAQEITSNQTETDDDNQLKQEVEEELKESLRDDLERTLKKELRESVKEELKLEMEYSIKKEIEIELSEELEKKKAIEKQKAKEQSVAVRREEKNTVPEVIEPAYQEVQKEILLVPIKVGQVIPMNNIFFEANESSLKNESFTELDRVLEFLQNNNSLIVEVGGHTNGWCSPEFAHELSSDRSKKVMNYFIENGIPANRIQNRGYGKTLPIASNETKAGRKKNQRVELKILEIK